MRGPLLLLPALVAALALAACDSGSETEGALTNINEMPDLVAPEQVETPLHGRVDPSRRAVQPGEAAVLPRGRSMASWARPGGSVPIHPRIHPEARRVDVTEIPLHSRLNSDAEAERAEATLPELLPRERAALENRDCRAVVGAYFTAIGQSDFGHAARFWADPAMDARRISQLYSRIVTPRLRIVRLDEEGAAGSLYCNVEGLLFDDADAAFRPIRGALALRRVNDVPGASAEQLRWTIRSSDFVEALGGAD